MSTLISMGFLQFGCRQREQFPNRPLVLICPWAPGGGTDQISRQVAALLEQELSVPVNVINATGGAGVTGHTRGALAKPDGYTLTMITPELNMLHWRGMTNVTYDDFEPLFMINRDDAALFVRTNDLRWKSLQDLTEAIRRSPKKFTASGTSPLGIWHLSLAGWLITEGLNPNAVRWIPNQGASPSLDMLKSRGVDMVCCSVPEALRYLEAGSLRCLGIMGESSQHAGGKEIPTFKDLGVNWSHRGWRGLALPKGVAPERVKVLTEALEKVVTGEKYKEFLQNNNFGHAAEPPAQFADFLKKDDQRYGEMLTSEAFAAVRRQRFGPYFFPGLLAVLLGGAVVLLLITGQLQLAMKSEGISRRGLWYVGAAVLWVILFAAALEWAGFVIAGTFFLCVLLLLLQVNWVVALVLPVVIVPALWQLFAVYLRVPLPWGWFGW